MMTSLGVHGSLCNQEQSDAQGVGLQFPLPIESKIGCGSSLVLERDSALQLTASVIKLSPSGRATGQKVGLKLPSAIPL